MAPTLTERLQDIAGELGKFVVVGGFCFVVDTVLAYVFYRRVGLGPTTSKTLSTIIATSVSYIGNRLWSFAHRVDDERGHRQDISVYAGINVVGLVITLIPVDVAHYLLDAKTAVAFTVSGIIGTAVATVFRFWAYRRWVFASAPGLAEKSALV